MKIPNKWHEFNQKDNYSELSLHQRLAMAQPFTVCKTTDINKLYKNATNDNFLTVNLGFLVSKKFPDENGFYHDKFITLPITDRNFEALRAKPKQEKIICATSIHSESGFYDYLNNNDRLNELVDMLYNDYHINQDYKVHVVVLDMHSTRDMCSPCQESTYRLLANNNEANNFFYKLEKLLEAKCNYGFPKPKSYEMILTPKFKKLNFVARISAEESVNLGQTNDDYGYPYSNNITKNISKDVRKYYNSVIVHDDTNLSKKCYDFFTSSTYDNLKKSDPDEIAISKQTTFVNYCSNRKYDDIKRLSEAEMFIKLKLS